MMPNEPPIPGAIPAGPIMPGLALTLPWISPMNSPMASCASGVVVMTRVSPSTLVSRMDALTLSFRKAANASAVAGLSL